LDTPYLLGDLVNAATEPENKGSWLPTCPKGKLGGVERGGTVKSPQSFAYVHGIPSAFHTTATLPTKAILVYLACPVAQHQTNVFPISFFTLTWSTLIVSALNIQIF
jgi:hypothetical protein